MNPPPPPPPPHVIFSSLPSTSTSSTSDSESEPLQMSAGFPAFDAGDSVASVTSEESVTWWHWENLLYLIYTCVRF